MAKKNHMWEWAAILGGAGILVYLYNKNQTTAVTTTTVTTPAIISPISSLPASATAVAQIDPGTIAIPTVTVSPETLAPLSVATVAPAATSSSSYSANQQTVINYFKTDLDEANLNQFTNNLANFTPAEWTGLYDLLVNDWEGGQGNTPARKQFWDTWRVKYHILDGTYA